MALTPEQQAKFDEICRRIAGGSSARAALHAEDSPVSEPTFYRWLDQDGDGSLRESYARACDARADAMVDDMIEIADNAEVKTYVDDKGKTRLDYSGIHNARLRVDTRKWIAARIAPTKYGDKQTINVNHGLQPTDDESLEARARRLAEKLGIALPAGPLIEGFDRGEDDGNDEGPD